MRTFRKMVVVLAFGCIAAMAAFPPWVRVYRDGNIKKSIPAGYGFITDPPNYYRHHGKGPIPADSIDYGKLGLQCLPFVGLIWWGTRKKESDINNRNQTEDRK